MRATTVVPCTTASIYMYTKRKNTGVLLRRYNTQQLRSYTAGKISRNTGRDALRTYTWYAQESKQKKKRTKTKWARRKSWIYIYIGIILWRWEHLRARASGSQSYYRHTCCTFFRTDFLLAAAAAAPSYRFRVSGVQPAACRPGSTSYNFRDA